jgi:hypothetical protein
VTKNWNSGRRRINLVEREDKELGRKSRRNMLRRIQTIIEKIEEKWNRRRRKGHREKNGDENKMTTIER